MQVDRQIERQIERPFEKPIEKPFEKPKPMEVEVKKPIVAPRTRSTMGEDYDEEPEEPVKRQPVFGSKKLPTFDELMALKKKPFDYNLDD